MVHYSEVKEQKERKFFYPDRHVFLPPLTQAKFGTQEYADWIEKNWWMQNYSVHADNKEKARGLAIELEKAFAQEPDGQAVQDIIEQLKLLQAKPYGDLSPVEVWTRSAYQLAEYAGGMGVRKAIVKRLGRYSGTILEAMCGHTTYFDESPGRKVIALDFCRESLEHYPHPERTRMECDLDQIVDGATLPFFKEEELDAISICFGFKYPTHIGPLVREFSRILKPEGALSFVENPCHEYKQLRKRQFSKRAVQILLRNGFRSVSICKLRVGSWHAERGAFYHIEAIK